MIDVYPNYLFTFASRTIGFFFESFIAVLRIAFMAILLIVTIDIKNNFFVSNQQLTYKIYPVNPVGGSYLFQNQN